MPKRRNNYRIQEDKDIVSSESESIDSGTEGRRQVYYRSRSRSPSASPDRRRKKRADSRHRRKSSDRHARHERDQRESYQPSSPSYQPPPPSYERDQRESYRPAPPRYQDDSHRPKSSLPRYEGWSQSNKVVRKRCAKEFSIHSNTPEVAIIGEKREKKAVPTTPESRKQKEKKRPRSISPIAGPSHQTQGEQPPTADPAQLQVVAGPSSQTTTGTSSQGLPPPAYNSTPTNYPAQLFHQPLFQSPIPQQVVTPNSDAIVMKTLQIVKEIMGLAGGIREGLPGGIRYFRKIQHEPSDEIITV